MIDSHTHTKYSKHARGTVAELVEAALQRQIKVLTITDHAPFYVDQGNRLLSHELFPYIEEVQLARQHYASDIKILLGLELDYMRGSEAYTHQLLDGLELDFIIGSIHYVPVGSELVKVWDLPRLNDKAVLDSYFAALEELITCGLFDAVGHADTLLRGVPESELSARLATLVHYFAHGRIAYELNASGARKSVYEPATRQEHTIGCASYPCQPTVRALLSAGTAFTIGSDAHAPEDVGSGIDVMLRGLKPLGLQTISYFERRQRIDVPLSALLDNRHCISDQTDGLLA